MTAKQETYRVTAISEIDINNSNPTPEVLASRLTLEGAINWYDKHASGTTLTLSSRRLQFVRDSDGQSFGISEMRS